jgi:hypothetical protein
MLATWGCIFLALHYVGGFSERQSVTLWLLLWVIYDLLMQTRRATQENFEPYTLWIEPKWRDLRRDYKLVKQEEWESLGSRISTIPESQYHVLRGGFHFTFLKPQPVDGLIYRDDRKYFRGELFRSERSADLSSQTGLNASR